MVALYDLYDWIVEKLTLVGNTPIDSNLPSNSRLNALTQSLRTSYASSTGQGDIYNRLNPAIYDLIMRFNSLCRSIEQTTGRRVLMVGDSIDHTNAIHGRSIFVEHATELTRLACPVIYTFPPALGYLADFRHCANEDYDHWFMMHNMSPNNRDSTPNQASRSLLREVILRRIDRSLIEEEALERIIELSGGHMRSLIHLMREALVQIESENIITNVMVDSIARQEQNNYTRALLPAHYTALRDVSKNKKYVDHPVFVELICNLSILEYEADELWYDINPLLRPLL